jgi:hypothetical protein
LAGHAVNYLGAGIFKRINILKYSPHCFLQSGDYLIHDTSSPVKAIAFTPSRFAALYLVTFANSTTLLYFIPYFILFAQ